MKLHSFTFHPHPIQVDGRPLHGVRVGDQGVTEISLFEGVLIVARGAQVWFTHTSYGTGVPVAGLRTAGMPEAGGPYMQSAVGALEQKALSPDPEVRLSDGSAYLAQTRKQRSKRQ